jgi:hypothetical protein
LFALQDKIDESEDKESILGNDILNPTTGMQQGKSCSQCSCAAQYIATPTLHLQRFLHYHAASQIDGLLCLQTTAVKPATMRVSGFSASC